MEKLGFWGTVRRETGLASGHLETYLCLKEYSFLVFFFSDPGLSGMTSVHLLCSQNWIIRTFQICTNVPSEEAVEE